YMADIAALCDRVIIIHDGKLHFDGSLTELIHLTAPFKVLHVALSEPVPDGVFERYGEVLEAGGERLSLRVPKEETPQVTSRLLADLPVADLTVEDPPIEAVIDRVFQAGLTAR
ncbi:MAG TPA: ABC transporter, partial [Limnochordia bacterium]